MAYGNLNKRAGILVETKEGANPGLLYVSACNFKYGNFRFLSSGSFSFYLRDCLFEAASITDPIPFPVYINGASWFGSALVENCGIGEI
jgi:hypothetical protein